MKLPIWIVERLEGDKVTAKTETGEHVSLALDAIQGTPKPGSKLRILAVTEGAEDTSATELVRALLNEILSKPKT